MMLKLPAKPRNLASGDISATAGWRFIAKSNKISPDTLPRHGFFRKNCIEVTGKGLRSTSVSLPSLPIFIAENAATAIANHDRIAKHSIPPFAIYTDGSKINNRLGAAAVAHYSGTYSQAYLDAGSNSTIHAAELMGVCMAIEIAIRTKFADVVIFSDSQAALRKIRHLQSKPDCYVVNTLTEMLREVYRITMKVQFHWIPSHKGIIGNQVADKLAKEAARY